MTSLAHDRLGSGPPLLLIHGLGSHRGIWQPVVERLSTHHEVIALDLPGFGDSPVLPRGMTATACRLASAVGELMESLGLPAAHIAGNSLGGWVALELARSEAVALSVTGLCTAGLWGRPLGLRPGPSAHAAARAMRPVLPLLVRSRAFRHAALSSVLASPDRMPVDVALETIRQYADGPAFQDANREMRSSVLAIDGPPFEVPVTLVWGDHDRLVRRPRKLPPGVRSIVFENCGHVPMWDQPDLTAGAILETIARAG